MNEFFTNENRRVSYMWTLKVKMKIRCNLHGKTVPRMEAGSKSKKNQMNDNNKKGNLSNHHLPLSLMMIAIFILEDTLDVWLSNPVKLRCRESANTVK